MTHCSGFRIPTIHVDKLYKCVQGFIAGAQDNWLITQLINRTVNGTILSQVSVMIEFEQRDCDVTLGCQRTFNTHVYERSSEKTASSKTISNYRPVQRVSPDDRVNETVIIDFVSTSKETSFYFSVQDETPCIVITRMIAFYHVCPQQTSYLIHCPDSGIISVTASFVENAGGLWSAHSVRQVILVNLAFAHVSCSYRSTSY